MAISFSAENENRRVHFTRHFILLWFFFFCKTVGNDCLPVVWVSNLLSAKKCGKYFPAEVWKGILPLNVFHWIFRLLFDEQIMFVVDGMIGFSCFGTGDMCSLRF